MFRYLLLNRTIGLTGHWTIGLTGQNLCMQRSWILLLIVLGPVDCWSNLNDKKNTTLVILYNRFIDVKVELWKPGSSCLALCIFHLTSGTWQLTVFYMEPSGPSDRHSQAELEFALQGGSELKIVTSYSIAAKLITSFRK